MIKLRKRVIQPQLKSHFSLTSKMKLVPISQGKVEKIHLQENVTDFKTLFFFQIGYFPKCLSSFTVKKKHLARETLCPCDSPVQIKDK